jgi:hypothetical protein
MRGVTIRKIQIRETKGEIEADKRKHRTDRNLRQRNILRLAESNKRQIARDRKIDRSMQGRRQRKKERQTDWMRQKWRNENPIILK